jgi:uncharacterized protein YjbI with pentapeptide repeats
MADERHRRILKEEGVEAWNIFREQNPDSLQEQSSEKIILRESGDAPDLSSAVLRDLDLRGANLRNVDLRGTDLRNTDLRGVDLRRALLSFANLNDANLTKANLLEANMYGAYAVAADFSHCDLRAVQFQGANLVGACFFNTDFCKSQVEIQLFR